MEKFGSEKVNLISRYAFLDKIDELDLPKGKKIHLRYGYHSEIIPFVEIIIPTYKRPQMLHETIQSILKSKDFDDYQIIIMDNEGVIEHPGITETEQMIKELDNSKIVYYREEENTPYNWNHLIRVSRAKWLCMVHDDDLIDPYHLKIMSTIVEKKKNIEFLGCYRETFSSENKEYTTVGLKKEATVIYFDSCKYLWGFQSSLLGAFFKRENAVDLGGFDTTILSGIGDYIFVAKQAFYYNTYCCELPLYKYRISMEQQSASNTGEYNCRISDYFLMRDIAKRTHPFLWRLYFKVVDKRWLYKVKATFNDKTYGNRELLIDEVCITCDIKKNKIDKKNLFHFLYLLIERIELRFPKEIVKLI